MFLDFYSAKAINFKSKIINYFLDVFNIANYPNLFEVLDIIQLDIENVFFGNVLYKIKIRLKEDCGISINNIHENKLMIENFLGNEIDFEIIDYKNLYVVVYKNKVGESDIIETENIKKYEYIPNCDFDIKKIDNVVKYEYVEGEKQGVSCIVGITLEGKYKEFNILEGHAMAGGASRWGKSSFLNTFITSIMLTYTPNEVIFLGCDYKFSDIYYFRKYEHWKMVATNKKEFISMMSRLDKTIEERAKILNEANCRNVIKYNKKSETKLSYIIVVIDELVLLSSDKDDPAKVDNKNILHSMMSKCASYGIYFILASQDFTKDTIGKCKMNCSQTIGFHTKDETDSTTLIGKGYDLQEINVKGRCKIENSEGVEETQIFFIEEEEIESLLKPFEKQTNTNI